MRKNNYIREAVESELEYDPLVDAANITVKVMSGNVALGGTVLSYPQCLEAAKAARGIADMASVRNNLEVLLPPEDYRDEAMLTTAGERRPRRERQNARRCRGDGQEQRSHAPGICSTPNGAGSISLWQRHRRITALLRGPRRPSDGLPRP
jgi:hypothetical protein